MKAKKTKIQSLSAADISADEQFIGLAGSPTQVVNVFSPEPRGNREIFSGSVEEQVDLLVERLKAYL